jgi:hypothetical protein
MQPRDRHVGALLDPEETAMAGDDGPRCRPRIRARPHPRRGMCVSWRRLALGVSSDDDRCRLVVAHGDAFHWIVAGSPGTGVTGFASRQGLGRGFICRAASLYGPATDYDVVEFLYTLSDTCVDVLEVTAAGVLLMDDAASLQIVAASSPGMWELELFEAESEEGPCADAHRNGESCKRGRSKPLASRSSSCAMH